MPSRNTLLEQANSDLGNYYADFVAEPTTKWCANSYDIDLR